jgi:hypothetical protein
MVDQWDNQIMFDFQFPVNSDLNESEVDLCFLDTDSGDGVVPDADDGFQKFQYGSWPIGGNDDGNFYSEEAEGEATLDEDTWYQDQATFEAFLNDFVASTADDEPQILYDEDYENLNEDQMTLDS